MTLEVVARGREERAVHDVGEGKREGTGENRSDGPLVDVTRFVPGKFGLADPGPGNVGTVPQVAGFTGQPVSLCTERAGARIVGRHPGDEDVPDFGAAPADVWRLPKHDQQRRPGTRLHPHGTTCEHGEAAGRSNQHVPYHAPPSWRGDIRKQRLGLDAPVGCDAAVAEHLRGCSDLRPGKAAGKQQHRQACDKNRTQALLSGADDAALGTALSRPAH